MLFRKSQYRGIVKRQFPQGDTVHINNYLKYIIIG